MKKITQQEKSVSVCDWLARKNIWLSPYYLAGKFQYYWGEFTDWLKDLLVMNCARCGLWGRHVDFREIDDMIFCPACYRVEYDLEKAIGDRLEKELEL